MEVSIRFASSLFALIILYGYSSAQTYSGASNIKLLGPVGSSTTTGVAGPEDCPMNFEKKKTGGRKMMVQSKRHMETVFLHEEGIDGDGRDHNQAILNPRITTSHRQLKEKMADVIAFNADYHVPRPHPPKNN